MKKFFRSSAFIAAFAFLAACGDNADSTQYPFADLSSTSGNVDASDVESAETQDDLPSCTSRRDGKVLFVEEDEAYFVCLDGVWEEIGEYSTTEDDLPSCSAKRDGQVYYVGELEEWLICTDRKWEKFDPLNEGSDDDGGSDGEEEEGEYEDPDSCDPVDISSSENEEGESSSSESFLFLSSSSSVVSVSYDCSIYHCEPTEYLNQTMLAAGAYGDLLDTRDNKVYKTIQIGEQTWMAQNLNYIPDLEAEYSWCYTDDENENGDCIERGRFYRWANALAKANSECGYGYSCGVDKQTQGVCPEGWHVPSKKNWQELVDYVGSESTLENSYGFSARPYGYRYYSGDFENVGYLAEFWIANQESSSYGYYASLETSSISYTSSSDKDNARPIRCMKDQILPEIVIPSIDPVQVGCGSASSCWLMQLTTETTVNIDIAFGTPKTNDFYIKNLLTEWSYSQECGDHICIENLEEDGNYIFVVNNWSDYAGVSTISEISGYFYGSIHAMDMWGKTDWNVTLYEVYELPTVIYNCENLETPPTFTSSVTGELVPYIEAMNTYCPNVRGNGSLRNCVNASDYASASSLYPNWF